MGLCRGTLDTEFSLGTIHASLKEWYKMLLRFGNEGPVLTAPQVPVEGQLMVQPYPLRIRLWRRSSDNPCGWMYLSQMACFLPFPFRSDDLERIALRLTAYISPFSMAEHCSRFGAVRLRSCGGQRGRGADMGLLQYSQVRRSMSKIM